MNVKIGAEAALIPEKEYISGIFVAVLPARPGYMACWVESLCLLVSGRTPRVKGEACS